MASPKLIAMAIVAASATWVCMANLPPEQYEAKATVKQVLCGRYCYPTVGFVSERHGAEDRSYALSAYDAVQIGSVYMLERGNAAGPVVFVAAALLSYLAACMLLNRTLRRVFRE